MYLENKKEVDEKPLPLEQGSTDEGDFGLNTYEYVPVLQDT